MHLIYAHGHTSDWIDPFILQRSGITKAIGHAKNTVAEGSDHHALFCGCDDGRDPASTVTLPRGISNPDAHPLQSWFFFRGSWRNAPGGTDRNDRVAPSQNDKLTARCDTVDFIYMFSIGNI